MGQETVSIMLQSVSKLLEIGFCFVTWIKDIQVLQIFVRHDSLVLLSSFLLEPVSRVAIKKNCFPRKEMNPFTLKLTLNDSLTGSFNEAVGSFSSCKLIIS